jgi:hypothetical protein
MTSPDDNLHRRHSEVHTEDRPNSDTWFCCARHQLGAIAPSDCDECGEPWPCPDASDDNGASTLTRRPVSRTGDPELDALFDTACAEADTIYFDHPDAEEILRRIFPPQQGDPQ